MPNLPLNLDLQHTQTQWASQLNPVLNNSIVQGRALNGIVLAANTPQTLNHSLGKNQTGFMVTDQNAAASIYRTQPFNSSTLTIEANAAVTVNLWVY